MITLYRSEMEEFWREHAFRRAWNRLGNRHRARIAIRVLERRGDEVSRRTANSLRVGKSEHWEFEIVDDPVEVVAASIIDRILRPC